jgi:hypothetical protein
LGNFYTNVTLKGPDQTLVVDYLKSLHRNAYVSPSLDGITVVYDAECERQDESILELLASELSRYFHCTALAVLIHDDDVLWYTLYQEGELRDRYNSNAYYFEAPSVSSPLKQGGDARMLAGLLGAHHAEKDVDAILRRSYTFEVERHTDLARVLGLPSFCVAIGYNYLKDEGPDLVEDTYFSRFAEIEH